MVYLVSFTPQNSCAILRGPRTFTPQNGCAILRGPRTFHPKNSRCSFSGAPISVSLVYLVSFTPQNSCAILRGPRSLFRWCISCLRHVFVIAPLLRRQSKKAKAQPEHSTDAQRRQLRTKHYALICPSPVRHTVYEGCNPGFHLLRKNERRES
jgi:hypothetical protein